MSSDKTINKLIIAVKNRPCIYDPTHCHHKNKKVINKCWNEIAVELNEKQQKISKLKRRWNGLMSSYAKYRKANNLTRESINDQYKGYNIGPQLDFLEPHFQLLTDQDSNSNSSTENESTHESVIESHETLITQTDDITYLFLSYAKTFRKLSPKVKISLKLELANLFLKAEWDQIQDRDYSIPLKMETHFSDDD
ncbi:uncharacterized protein LOC119838153 [Zerene cesonia]|uniref:uncharacterized protein LOC119838153 n=1 Tax=Zerene cesonia TaxID=33412 RepID=UPI0018E4F2DB|nr:uncharacterized protein LOC119838153 [Zerene cesonia]